MASSVEIASSLNSSLQSKPSWKFHVFLSFRGIDTRTSFIDCLYANLQRKGIITYKDDEQLERGEVISQQLPQAIEESLSAIVVLSPNYASSSWCLDELLKILECKTVLRREVFPIFYDVNPSDVRYQMGSFGEAFKKHETRFKEDKIKRWRDALKEIANLSGWNSNNRPHTELIEEIIAELWRKVQTELLSSDDGLVGINTRLEDFFSLLDRGLEDVCFVGIWGMGGIGKTTLARAIFDTVNDEFEISCFLQNVREVSECGESGLVKLQMELLSHLKIKGLEVGDSHGGKEIIRKLLCNKKVLLVLDDVCADSQLEKLANNQNWFGQGSRIIITTRDRHLLTLHGRVSKIHKCKILNSKESLQLFCQKAFSGQPDQFYQELSKKVVQYACGLPLALKVLGSFFYGRSKAEWEDALKSFRKEPPKDIISTLQVSYETLRDDEKNIFLNIACFFKGMEQSYVINILEICNLHPTIGIKVLLEKSLITVYHHYGDCHFGMHDMLQEMGKNIVIHESINDAWKRSRLWLQEDIDHALTNNKGTEVTNGIVLGFSWQPCEAHWDPTAFLKMDNLKFLDILKYLDLPLGLSCLSQGLKYLEWDNFPLKNLPLGQQLDELVEIRMQRSNISQLWNGSKCFRKLKLVDLSYSKDLKRFPSVSRVPCLEQLILKGCTNLVKVHESVGMLKKLMVLNLAGCAKLKIIPRKLIKDSLKVLILSDCSKLKEIPEFGDNLKSLRILNIQGCSNLSMLPENLAKNEALKELNLNGTAITEVPPSILHLKYLERLSLGRPREKKSNKLNLFPAFRWKFWQRPKFMNLPPLSNFHILTELHLTYCNIGDESLPVEIGCLSSLTALRLTYCNIGDESLLVEIGCLSSLTELHLMYCNIGDESLPVEIGCLSSLTKLDLSGNHFSYIPASCFATLSKLSDLMLECCPRLQSVPMLPPNISWLSGRNSASWQPLSDPLFLLNYFSSLILQVKSCSHPFLMIPGSEIPPLLSNQNYFHIQDICSPLIWGEIEDDDDKEPFFPDCHSMVSIIVDIPDYCFLSEWWGILECLVLENPLPASRLFWTNLYWICKTPEAALSRSSCELIHFLVDQFTGAHLCFLFLPGDHENIQRHLTGGHNQIQLLFHALARFSSVKDDTDNLKISKCGCRVLCKEDLEMWGKAMNEHRESNNLEISSSCVKESRIIEISDDTV